MQKKFSGVKVCVWDFDGTLYRAGEAFHQEILESQYRIIMNHRGWSRDKAVEEFHKLYKITTPSSTEAASVLAKISLAQAAIEGELDNYRLKYISRDEKLVGLFRSLATFTHFILANGIREKIIPALAGLGIPPETFGEIVTSEIVGVNKPQPDGFRYIMKKTGLPAEAHLMIGDREAVDLAPAKTLGMHTCLVSWGVTKPQTDCVDDVIPDIYTVARLLL